MEVKRDAKKGQFEFWNISQISQLIVIKTITCYRDERRLIR